MLVVEQNLEELIQQQEEIAEAIAEVIEESELEEIAEQASEPEQVPSEFHYDASLPASYDIDISYGDKPVVCYYESTKDAEEKPNGVSYQHVYVEKETAILRKAQKVADEARMARMLNQSFTITDFKERDAINDIKILNRFQWFIMNEGIIEFR